MKKRILFLFLILMLSINYPALANEDSVDYSKSIEFLTAVGVLDNYTAADTENEMSRIEFASVISKIAFPDCNYACSTEMVYTDVDKEYEDILVPLAEQKIMRGYDEYTFKPEQTITYTEALKVLVTLTGYDYQAVSSGGYPNGYLLTASSVGILKNFNNLYDHGLRLGEAARLIENALKIDVVYMDVGDEGTVYASEKGENLLKRKFDIYEGEGLFRANENTDVYGGEFTPENSVVIGNGTYEITNNDFESYLGHNVEFYYKLNKDDTAEVLYMTNGNKVSAISVKSYELTGYYDRQYSYYPENGSHEKKAYISKNAAVLYNYRLPISKKGEELYLPEVGEIELIDNDGDKEYDVVFIWDYETYVIESISAESYIISDYYKKDSLELDPDKVDSRIVLDGAETGIGALEKWNVLSVAKSEGDSPFITVIASDDMITGSVTSVGDGYISIDGTRHNISPALNQKVSAGQTFDFYLDYLGYVAVYDKNSSADYIYRGILIRYFMTEDFEDTAPDIMIFTEEGEMTRYPVAERISFDGRTGTKSVELLNKNNPSVIIDDKGIIPQMIFYKLNKEGQVSFIDTVDKGANEDDDSLNQSRFFPSRSGNGYQLMGHSWNEEIAMANGLIIFKVPSDGDGNIYRGKDYDKYYGVQTWGPWYQPFYDHYDTYTVRFFNVKEAQTSDLMIWYIGVDGSDPISEKILLIEDIGPVLSPENEVVMQLSGWDWSDVSKKYIIEEEKQNLGEGIKSGDVVLCGFNNDGEVMTIEKLLTPDTDDFGMSNTSILDERIIYGIITEINRTHGVILVSTEIKADGTWKKPGVVCVLNGEGDYKGQVLKYNAHTNQMEKGTREELTVGQRVVVNKESSAVRSVFVLED